MRSRLQLDVRNFSLGRRHLVNAYEAKAGIGVIAGNTVWPMPERLRGFTTKRYINPLYLYLNRAYPQQIRDKNARPIWQPSYSCISRKLGACSAALLCMGMAVFYSNGIIDDSWHRPSLVCDSATQLSPTLTVYRRQQLSSETLYGDVRDAESLLRLPKHVHGVVVVVVSIVVVVVVFVVVRRTCLCRSQLRQVNNLLIF